MKELDRKDGRHRNRMPEDRTGLGGAWARLWGIVVSVMGLVVACGVYADDQTATLGVPRVMNGRDAPNAQALANLGRKLFFDATLSADGTVSCSTCHQPDKAFADGKAVAQGVGGRKGLRNTPSLFNAGYLEAQFWDGRRPALEMQVLDPLFNPREHALDTPQDLIAKVVANRDLRSEFQRIFGIDSATNVSQVAAALAAYVRTLVSGGSPADRYLYSGQTAALTESQIRGLELFRGRAQCVTCHFIGEASALYTDHRYHNHSVGFDQLAPKLAELVKRVASLPAGERDRLIIVDPEVAALGRYVVTLDPKDIGRFKTPSLRNVSLTAPYMHDGSIATLDEAVTHEVYYRGRTQGRPLVLTPGERQDLVDFLQALTGDQLPSSAVAER